MNKSGSKHQKKRRRQWRWPTSVVAAGSVGSFLWMFGWSLWHHSSIEKSMPKSNPKVVSPHALIEFEEQEITILTDIWPDDHDETEFAASLNSCVDDCLGGYIPPKRVGLLYPPGDFGHIFVELIHLAAKTHAPHSKVEIVWEPTSHLPSPDHLRYSHVIRFANLPLILAAGDAVVQFWPEDDITWRDIEDTVKMLIYWHCHLSNLVPSGSASFPLMTMTMEEIEEDAPQQMMLLEEFLPDLEPNDDDDEGMNPNSEDSLANNLREIVDRIKPLLHRLDADFRNDPRRSPQDKNLEGLVKRITKEFLTDDTTCPKTVPPLFVPSVDAARAVYESIKALPATRDPYRHDTERCTEDSVSDRNFCRKLPKVFDTKGLVMFLYQRAKFSSNQDDATTD